MAWLGRLARFRLGKSEQDVDRAIRCVVAYAYEHTAHYRRLFDDAGLRPDRIEGARDLPRVPVTTRDAIGEEPWRSILSDRAVESRCRRALTSGSTGTLLAVHLSAPEAYYRRLLLLCAFYKNLGLRLPLRVAEVGPRDERPPDDLVQRVGLIHVAHVRLEGSVAEAVGLLRRFRPHILTGAPSCLELLAEEWRDEGCGDLRLIVARGEVLGREARERLASAFRRRVVDYYGCEEVGNVAWECPDDDGRLHVNTDACVLEVVSGAGRPVPRGTEGAVVVTSLFSYTMPFVRYALGDRTHFLEEAGARCRCGSALPAIAAPSGRDEDFLVLRDGRRVSPRTLDNVVGHALYARTACAERAVRYRIVQEEVDVVRVEAVIPEDAAEDLQVALDVACRGLSADLRCRLYPVVGFPEDGTGKFRRVVSRIS